MRRPRLGLQQHSFEVQLEYSSGHPDLSESRSAFVLQRLGSSVSAPNDLNGCSKLKSAGKRCVCRRGSRGSGPAGSRFRLTESSWHGGHRVALITPLNGAAGLSESGFKLRCRARHVRDLSELELTCDSTTRICGCGVESGSRCGSPVQVGVGSLSVGTWPLTRSAQHHDSLLASLEP